MREEHQSFANGRGQTLRASLCLPAGTPKAWALFAHCFTCSRNLRAAYHICQAMAKSGIATLRFDFTGLGESDGDFSVTHFSSNVDDLLAAARHLQETVGHGPGLLVGHSFGGAAVLQAAGRIDSCRAVATIGAPSDPQHVTRLLTSSREAIEQQGEAEVQIAGRSFTIRREFLHDLDGVRMQDTIGALQRALLVLHAPFDDIVGIDNASRIFEAARHPKSFVSLDGADHLLRDDGDASYAGDVIACWALRYTGDLGMAGDLGVAGVDPGVQQNGVVVSMGRTRYRADVHAAGHTLVADEPLDAGGGGFGPGPYDLLLAALGTCTAMTLRMYADHKGWDLTGIQIYLQHDKVHARDCKDCETRDGRVDQVEREIELTGELDTSQRLRLLQIADRCPVHRTLQSEVRVRTRFRENA
jgi:uncharacterized OsmC-like protein/alpha/beta superfamily hydrolase